MTSSCIFGFDQVEILEQTNFSVFDPIWLKFGIAGKVETLMTEINPD